MFFDLSLLQFCFFLCRSRNLMSLRQARRNPWTSLSISNVRADFEVPGEIEMPAFLMADHASILSILSYEWIYDLKIKI